MPRLSVDKQTAMLQNVRRHMLTYKAERLANGANMGDIAAALGFKLGTMNNRIRNPEGLTFTEVMRIANTLNISIPVLIGIAAPSAPVKEDAV